VRPPCARGLTARMSCDVARADATPARRPSQTRLLRRVCPRAQCFGERSATLAAAATTLPGASGDHSPSPTRCSLPPAPGRGQLSMKVYLKNLVPIFRSVAGVSKVWVQVASGEENYLRVQQECSSGRAVISRHSTPPLASPLSRRPAAHRVRPASAEALCAAQPRVAPCLAPAGSARSSTSPSKR